MGLFGHKKTSLEASGAFRGLTDWHSHILPGVDDGVRSLDESLAILGRYEELGVEHLWLTPHIMEDVPNTPADLRRRFDELREAYNGPVELHLAAENMLDTLFLDRLDAGDLLPLGADGRHLLVETSYYQPPVDFDRILRSIFSAGYYPVLAHPERYMYMDRDYYRRLLDMGVIFQLNLFSAPGCYGSTVAKKQTQLRKLLTTVPPVLPANSPDAEPAPTPYLTGSDLHSLSQLQRFSALPF